MLPDCSLHNEKLELSTIVSLTRKQNDNRNLGSVKTFENAQNLDSQLSDCPSVCPTRNSDKCACLWLKVRWPVALIVIPLIGRRGALFFKFKFLPLNFGEHIEITCFMLILNIEDKTLPHPNFKRTKLSQLCARSRKNKN